MGIENNSRTKLICFSQTSHAVSKRSVHRNIRSRRITSINKKHSSNHDSCALKGNYDVFSDDDVSQKHKKHRHVENKFIKSQILNNESTTAEIQQKFHSIDKENAKIQSKIKALCKDILKKDNIIDQLTKMNAYLKEQLRETAQHGATQNTDLIELASINNRLQKDIERKSTEISDLQSKINKSEFIRNNLLKDIDFYKTELNAAKNDRIFQQTKYSEEQYERLQKKFNEIKIENSKLCRKFKEIRLLDEDNATKTHSYHLLFKKFETVQQDMMKLKMENKKLKDKIRKSKQPCDCTEINTANVKENDEIQNLTKIVEKLERETEIYKTKLEESQLEERKTKNLLSTLQTKMKECKASNEEEIKGANKMCAELRSKLEEAITEKGEILKQHYINEENTNKLKLKLNEVMHEKSELLLEKDGWNKDDNICENCVLLKQEVEKLGYANLRLSKEKQNLQSNFQKLSIKTSKLTLKMEELEQEKQRGFNNQSENQQTDENLLQQNVLLSKRLHDLLKKSEKLFKARVKQQSESEKDITVTVSNENIIEELNENLSFSKSNLEKIENKLEEEEWKLNAALKHIRQVKEQIKRGA